MPYFVFHSAPQGRLTCVARFDSYREARALVRERRTELSDDDETSVRMIFAPSEQQADKLLRTPREARSLGEDA
jgi:hypothetical protein